MTTPPIDASTQAQLVSKAKEALGFSYAKYSGFKVGAALLTKQNDIIMGCNIENRFFNLTICAERVAISKALSDGHKEFIALGIACVNQDDQIQYNAYPCGACRQFLIEFAPNLPVIIAINESDFKVTSVQELLP